MEHNLTLLYMGGLIDDRLLRESVRRQVEALGRCILDERRLPKLDPDTPLNLRKELGNEGAYLILCDDDSFALVGRILSTLSDRPLRLGAYDLLLPEGATETGESAYTLSLGSAVVTVLRCSPQDPFPRLPMDDTGGRTWQLFPRSDAEERTLLLRLAEAGGESVTWTRILPGWLQIRVCGEETLSRVAAWLKDPDLHALNAPSLVQAFIDYFSTTEKTLTFAESCTGGRLAAAITAESGSSAILEGSYVTYANRIKSGWLGVRAATLREHGAVSAECVREMARGAQRNLDADIAVAISGIAGPTGAVPGKPVGTVYLCVRNGTEERIRRLQLRGDRNAVQDQAVLHALKMVLESEEKIFDFFSKNP